LVNQNLPLATI